MLRSELFDMRVAFSHHHVNNGHNRDDSCAVCGLDLRDKVHHPNYLEAQRVKGMSQIATIIHSRSSER